MARIAGIELQDKWKVPFALTRIKGIGWPLSTKILAELKMDNSKRVENLSSDDLAKIASVIEKYAIEGELIRTVRSNTQRLKTIGSFRGLRHARNLPARGKRKTVGAFKKEALSKMSQKVES